MKRKIFRIKVVEAADYDRYYPQMNRGFHRFDFWPFKNWKYLNSQISDPDWRPLFYISYFEETTSGAAWFNNIADAKNFIKQVKYRFKTHNRRMLDLKNRQDTAVTKKIIEYE